MGEHRLDLVSARWLADRLDDPKLRVLDATWDLPGTQGDAKSEYEAAHIPGARFFDIDAIADTTSDLPHMVPPPKQFAAQMQALGIGAGHQVVVYDTRGLFSAARVWWLFRLMGHSNTVVLDGGLPLWQAGGYPISRETVALEAKPLTPKIQPSMICNAVQMAKAAQDSGIEIIDARPAARFQGKAAEPRKGLRAGHIPSAKNVPFSHVLNTDGTLKAPQELRAIFTDAGVDLSKPAITSCGSGITAAILTLALVRIGKLDHALYDGSWAEWGQDASLPIEIGS